MDKTYIVVYEIIDSYYCAETEKMTFGSSEEVFSFILGFTNNKRNLIRIFSVDILGTKITHFNVVFDGHLQLEEIK